MFVRVLCENKFIHVYDWVINACVVGHKYSTPRYCSIMPVLKRKAVDKNLDPPSNPPPPSPPDYVPPKNLQAKATTNANDKLSQASSTQAKEPINKKKKMSSEKINRYEQLRVMSDGIIQEDAEQGGIRDRAAIIERFGLRDANNAIAASVRISF